MPGTLDADSAKNNRAKSTEPAIKVIVVLNKAAVEASAIIKNEKHRRGGCDNAHKPAQIGSSTGNTGTLMIIRGHFRAKSQIRDHEKR